MKDWWESLQSRERYMVLVAGALVLLTLLYFAIWSPIASSRDSKQARVDAKRDTVVWMLTKKQEVEHLKRINPNLCLLYTSPSPRDQRGSRMPSSA